MMSPATCREAGGVCTTTSSLMIKEAQAINNSAALARRDVRLDALGLQFLAERRAVLAAVNNQTRGWDKSTAHETCAL